MGRGRRDNSNRAGNTKVGWLRKRMLIEGARASYRMLTARDMRLLAADFTADEPFVMVFGRGERAEELRTLVKEGTVAVADRAKPTEQGEVAERDKSGLEMAARSAFRLMRKQGKTVFTVEFAEEVEPMLTVYARGEAATSLQKALHSVGLVHPASFSAV